MFRFLAPALLCAASLPAWAETCAIVRDVRFPVTVSADIDGVVARKLMTRTGPFVGGFVLESAAEKAGYAFTPGERAHLYIYRSGASIDGKDWREAGSIATTEAGFSLDWPQVTLNGKLVNYVMVDVKLRNLVVTTPIIAPKPRTDPFALIVRFNDEIEAPNDTVDIPVSPDAAALPNVREQWAATFSQHSEVDLVLRNGRDGTQIGHFFIGYPATATRQAWTVDDVNALRAAHAAKQCAPAN